MSTPHRKPNFLVAASVTLALSLLAANNGKSADLYWDANGSEPGAGTAPTGEWGVDSFWNALADGTGTPGSYSPGSNVYFSAGDDSVNDYTVTLNGTESVNSLHFTSPGAVTITGTGQITLGSGGLTASNDSTISTITRLSSNQTWNVSTGSTLTQYGNILGSFGITKTGGGTLVIGGINGGAGTLFSNLRISEGRVNVTGHGIIGLSNVITLDNVAGAELDFTGAINSKGFGALNGGGDLGGNVHAATAIAFYGGATSVGDYSGVISGMGGFSMMGAGKQTLRGENTFRGVVSVNRGGTLVFTSIGDHNSGASALGGQTTILASTINFGLAADTVGSTLEYIGTGHSSNRNFTMTAVNAGATIVANGTGALELSGKLTSVGAGSKTLILTGTNTDNNAFSGVIADNSVTHKTSLTKKGAGTWVIGGANTYTGATTVEAGRLVINGSVHLDSTVAVHNGATLGGIGTIGLTTVDGTLAPGNSIGTLNTGDLTFSATSSFDVELGRSGGIVSNDRVNVAGGVTILDGANINLTLLGTAPQAGDLLFLIINDASDAVSGQFTSLNGTATTLSEGAVFDWNSLQWEVTYLADYGNASFTGGNDFAIHAIPEPSTWVLLAGSLSAMALYRRRQVR